MYRAPEKIRTNDELVLSQEDCFEYMLKVNKQVVKVKRERIKETEKAKIAAETRAAAAEEERETANAKYLIRPSPGRSPWRCNLERKRSR